MANEGENNYPTEWPRLVDEDYEKAKETILNDNKNVGFIEELHDDEKPFEFRRSPGFLRVKVHVRAGKVVEPFPRVDQP
ncbi:hypothetical protein ACP4OV_017347 [Aristida adscensionis]